MTEDLEEGVLESERGDFHDLASLIEDREADIVSAWVATVFERLKMSKLDRTEVENAISIFLRHVARQLRHGGTGQAASASEHGEQRFRIGYELAEMLKEYGLLLDAIESVAAKHQIALTASSFAALARNVVRGSAQAVLAFVEEERQATDAIARRRLAFLAHELRGPIQNVILGIEAWAAGANPEAVRRAMERSVTSLRNLVDEELLRAQASARVRPEPRPEPFDFVALTNEVMDATKAFAQAKDINLEVNGPASLPVQLDRLMLWSVVTNLVRNGVKFSQRGGSVALTLAKKGDRLRLTVRDTCGGLSEELRTQIFQDFKKAGSDRSGFGLGLGIANQAITVHQGTISVTNHGQGCMFVCDLPLIYSPEPGMAGQGTD